MAGTNREEINRDRQDETTERLKGKRLKAKGAELDCFRPFPI
jgi:hypothetical protein